jgi:hypothetical protein
MSRNKNPGHRPNKKRHANRHNQKNTFLHRFLGSAGVSPAFFVVMA